ncbi:MAG: helix-turn-helix domain-containing protein [Anaerolineales bacterium]|nr:helix-turn-helix domain-containing protein [Anaerolineales bacterium]
MSKDPNWLSLSQVAQLLGVHPSTVRLWADKGDLPVHRTAGQHRRFKRADVEAWTATRREAQHPTEQMIVQAALGRTRLQMTEGRLQNQKWYAKLGEARRTEFREVGRRLLNALLQYLGEEETEAAVAAAQAVGRDYERLGRAAGLTLAETVRLFQFFDDFLYESVVDVYQAQGRRAAREWAAMHRRVAAFTKTVMLALVEAHSKK